MIKRQIENPGTTMRTAASIARTVNIDVANKNRDRNENNDSFDFYCDFFYNSTIRYTVLSLLCTTLSLLCHYCVTILLQQLNLESEI